MSKERDIGLDITRIIAFMSVVSVHFFLNNNFYNVPVTGITMYLMVIIRNIFMICVPLFMILTGYLMSHKDYIIESDYLKHLSKIKRVVCIYILSTILILIFQNNYLDENISLKDSIFNILGYKQYSWYINQYIGLYLLIPFLNNLWNSINSLKGKRILILVLVFITVAPSVFNVYDFYTENLFYIQTSQNFNKIVPDFWQGIYPITYYFIGAYLKEVDLKKMNSLLLFLFLIFSFVFFGIYNIWRSYNVNFVWGSWCDWGSLQNTINSVIMFIFLNSFSFSPNKVVSLLLKYLSNLTLGAYLLSYIPDKMIYPRFNDLFTMHEKLIRFPIVVGIVIFFSFFLSTIVNGVYSIGDLVYKCLRRKIASK